MEGVINQDVKDIFLIDYDVGFLYHACCNCFCVNIGYEARLLQHFAVIAFWAVHLGMMFLRTHMLF